MRHDALAGCALLLVLPGCGSTVARPSVPRDGDGAGVAGRPSVAARPAGPAATGAVQLGVASWYGPGFHGKPTASGEVYDQYDLTAAHQTLPLGTRVAVTNLHNGQQVEVRINDRGPFVDARVIDLSLSAARALGMIEPGTVPVRIEVLEDPRVRFAPLAYTIQIGAFADRGRALRLEETLSRRFDGVYVTTRDDGVVPYYRVRLGRFDSRDEAAAQARLVSTAGLPAIIVEDDRMP